MTRRRKSRGYRWRAALFVVIFVLLLPAGASAVLFWYAYKYKELLKFDGNGFGDAANWLQVLVALWTFAATTVGAWQIFDLKKQTRIQQDQAKAAAYRTLISPQMLSIKRFLRTDKVGELLESIWVALGEIPVENEKEKKKKEKKDLQQVLDRFRRRIDEEGLAMEMPLLGRQPCLDDIEAVVNEYNYLCKLIIEGTIDANFATEMSRANLRRIYSRLKPFLKLRRRLAGKYASHFVRYMRKPASAV